MAGALEHWQTDSLFWAEDMFATAHNLLAKYAPRYQGLDVDALLTTLQACNAAVQAGRVNKRKANTTSLIVLQLHQRPIKWTWL